MGILGILEPACCCCLTELFKSSWVGLGDGVATNCDVDMVDDRDANGTGTVGVVDDEVLAVPLTFS